MSLRLVDQLVERFENWSYIDGPHCKTLADAVNLIDEQAKAIDPELYAEPHFFRDAGRYDVNVIGPIGPRTPALLVWATVRTR